VNVDIRTGCKSKGKAVTISLVDISVQWLQFLVSKMEFTVLNSPKGFWRSLPKRSQSFLNSFLYPNLKIKTRLPTHWYPFPLHSQGLPGIQLWAHILCAHLNFELRDCLITFPNFVPSQCLIVRIVRELFSFNRGVSHLNEACRIDDVSRGSLSCYEILTDN
jgi:hypothetical protein